MHLPLLLPLLAVSSLVSADSSSSSSSSSRDASSHPQPQRLGKPGSGAAGLGSSSSARPFPEDVFARPPHRLSFEGPPVRNGTVGRVLGGEETLEAGIPHLFRSPSGPYLCHLPPPPSPSPILPPLSPSALSHERLRALSSGLSLLEPLRQTCLYHTLDWFTYEFCHGRSVRQFHALASSALPGRTPVPDPKQDSYVLGRAPHAQAETTDVARRAAAEEKEEGTELMEVVSFSVGEANSEEAHGQRYLSQTWGGGTLCAISNEPRSVEVQFHCSKRPGDRISLVKETTTCNYVLIVDTPRLCADAVFAVPEEAVHDVICRPIVSDNWRPSSPARTTAQLDGRAGAPAAASVSAAAREEEADEDEESGFHTRGDPFELGGLPDGGGEMWGVDVDEDGLPTLLRYDEEFDLPASSDEAGYYDDAEDGPLDAELAVAAEGELEIQLIEGDLDPAVHARIQRHINDVAARAAREDAQSKKPRSDEERWEMLQQALREALADNGVQGVVHERPTPGMAQQVLQQQPLPREQLELDRQVRALQQQREQGRLQHEARPATPPPPPRARQGLAAAPAPAAPPAQAAPAHARPAPPPPPAAQAARPAPRHQGQAAQQQPPPPPPPAAAAAAGAANGRLEAAIAAALEATKKLREGGGGAQAGGAAAAGAAGAQGAGKESLGERAERFWREKEKREREQREQRRREEL